jgi:hypothetical protein
MVFTDLPLGRAVAVYNTEDYVTTHPFRVLNRLCNDISFSCFEPGN